MKRDGDKIVWDTDDAVTRSEFVAGLDGAAGLQGVIRAFLRCCQDVGLRERGAWEAMYTKLRNAGLVVTGDELTYSNATHEFTVFSRVSGTPTVAERIRMIEAEKVRAVEAKKFASAATLRDYAEKLRAPTDETPDA